MELQIVSFELAKKLKEIDFDEPVEMVYRNNEHKRLFSLNMLVKLKDRQSIIAAPTQALAQMWFREKYKIIITIMFELDAYECLIDNGYNVGSEGIEKTFDIYEEALEAGLLKACEIIKNK